MRKMYQQAWQDFFRDSVYKERKRMGLSQNQMSEILLMDPRTYSDLENGYSSCGALTLIRFLAFCCESPVKFVEDAAAVFRKLEEDEYASV